MSPSNLKNELLKNQEHLRVCVFYEVLQKKPLLEAYQSFCKTLDVDAMDYAEFEQFYWHYANGDHELEHNEELGKDSDKRVNKTERLKPLKPNYVTYWRVQPKDLLEYELTQYESYRKAMLAKRKMKE